ncbi:unnamed protein product [Schistosoma rodhaini]|nr:unnamed protein product [Schistosoma rodhaini]
MGKHKFKTRCYLDIKIDSQPAGRIVFELFNDICPKAAENFKKLCQGVCGLGLKTGKPLTYQGSVFHRVIKGFMVQGGDFSNKDGTGGESIYGGTFADECLTTEHDRPFLLSMANRGPNTNGSQFFITTAPAPHLNGKHMIFGHVISGEDVVRKIEAVPISDTKAHRPVKSIVIESCGELIPVKKSKVMGEEKKSKKAKKAKKKKRKLSEGEEFSDSESGMDNECSVRKEEVPEVPPPKFLYRGNYDEDQLELQKKVNLSPSRVLVNDSKLVENGSSPTQNNLSPVSAVPKKIYIEFEGKPDDTSDRRCARSPEDIRQTSVSENLFGKDRRANQRLSEVDDEYVVDVDEDAKFKTLPTTTHEQSPKLSKFSEYSTVKSNDVSKRDLGDSPKAYHTNQSPGKYSGSPNLKSPQQILISPVNSCASGQQQKYQSKSPVLMASPKLPTPFENQAPIDQPIIISPSRIPYPSPPSRSGSNNRMPSPPSENARISSPPDFSNRNQVSHELSRIPTPPQPDNNKEQGKLFSEETDLHILEEIPSPEKPRKQPSPSDKQLKVTRGSRSASRSSTLGSRSNSSCESDSSRSCSRSHSQTSPKKRRRRTPRSPPPHLVEKWKMRREMLNQKRRVVPPSVAAYAPSGSSEDRLRGVERRHLSGRSTHIHSRSPSRSIPSRRRSRSSSSRSKSGSYTHGRTKLNIRRGSPEAESIRSRRRSPSRDRKTSRSRSHSRSPPKSFGLKHRGTSPSKPIIVITKKSQTTQKPTKIVTEDPPTENTVTTSKWENSPQIVEKNTNQHLGPWTNKHWETGDKVELDESVNKDEKKLATAKTQGPNSTSVLQRLRVVQEDSSKNEVHLHKNENSSAAVIDNKEKLENSIPASNETTSIPTVPTMIKPQVPPISRNQVKKPTAIRGRSHSSSSSSASSSSSSGSSSRSSSRPKRSRKRCRSISSSARKMQRSDFSDSRSRGRGSRGRYSPVSRSYYTRSRSRSFSTRASTNWGTRTSYPSRNRSWSRSRSRSFSRDSRSHSSSARRHKRRHRRTRRGRNSSRSWSSSRSSSRSIRRR